MQINVGIAQTPNSTDIAKNFRSIMKLLKQFQLAGAELVVFPECSLSGFSAKMKDCTLDVLDPYLEQIQIWVIQNRIEVLLPTACADNGRIYNGGRWFKTSGNSKFYKVGLTDSEQKFFSVPETRGSKVFEIKGFRFAVLICFEAEHEPWTYFTEGSADAILWPSYWGWTMDSQWNSKKEDGRLNPIFSNLQNWKMPVLQANFAFNDLEGHSGSEPEGLSFAIGPDNVLVARGPHKQVGGLLVRVSKDFESAYISECVNLA